MKTRTVLAYITFATKKLIFTFFISSNFKVQAYRSKTKVEIRDLLSFQWKLLRWSQLEAIISRTKHFPLSSSAEITSTIRSLKERLDSCDVDDDSRYLHNILFEQFELSESPKNSRRYSSETMKLSTSLYLSSRNAYSHLRSIFHLPHGDTVKKQFGRLGRIGTEAEAKSTIEAIFSSYSGLKKNCCVLFDEIYVKPSLRFRGHVIGEAEDNPQKVARTVLTMMVKPLFTSECFVVRLIPVYSLTGEFLFDQLCRLIRIVHECGSKVLSLICDNAAVNRNCYKRFQLDSEKPWLGLHPHDPNLSLYLLYDSVHLLKNVRNNWISEKTKRIELELSDHRIVGRWSDVTELYNKESIQVIRRTKLKHQSCFPSQLELQKVSLVLDVFDERTVAALIADGKNETAEFINFFLRLWKFLNLKNPHLHYIKNDNDRLPFASVSDPRFDVMEKAADTIQKMHAEEKSSRQMSFTKATRDALVQTLRGLVAIGRHLLHDKACKYVMFGVMQNDPLESEFGIYRQLSGGNYFISFEQILSSAHLRRLELFHKLGVSSISSEGNYDSCCNSDFTSEEVELLDNAVENSEKISLSEKSTLLYICGYIAYKENLSHSSQFSEEDSEFTRLVSRGKLSFPPTDLFQFSIFAYSFFISLSNPCCANRVTKLLVFLCDSLFFNFPSATKVCRRLSNSFLKGLVVRSADGLHREQQQKAIERRKRKLDK